MSTDYAHTEHAEANRKRKATALAIASWDLGITAAELADLGADARKRLAKEAGVPNPSTVETWALVGSMLTAKERWAVENPDDPRTAHMHAARHDEFVPAAGAILCGPGEPSAADLAVVAEFGRALEDKAAGRTESAYERMTRLAADPERLTPTITADTPAPNPGDRFTWPPGWHPGDPWPDADAPTGPAPALERDDDAPTRLDPLPIPDYAPRGWAALAALGTLDRKDARCRTCGRPAVVGTILGWACQGHPPAPGEAGSVMDWTPNPTRYCAPLRCYCGRCDVFQPGATPAGPIPVAETALLRERAVAGGKARASAAETTAARHANNDRTAREKELRRG